MAKRRTNKGGGAAVAEPKQASDTLDGLYEIYLEDECPVGTVALPAIRKPDYSHRVEWRWVNISAKKGAHRIPQLVCPTCGHRWEAQRPRRPHSALKDIESTIESKAREAHRRSWDCPKCRESQGPREDGLPRGDYRVGPRSGDGGRLPLEGQRTERRVYYLTDEEVRRVQALIDPDYKHERVYTEETLIGDSGRKVRRPTGWKDGIRPLIYRKNRGATPVNLCQYIVFHPVNARGGLTHAQLEAYDRISLELGDLTEEWRQCLSEVDAAETQYREAAESGDRDLMRAAQEEWDVAKATMQAVDDRRAKLLARIPGPGATA